MRTLLVLALLAVAVISGTESPAAAEEPHYPVICIYTVLPDGTPLPVVCVPDPT